MSKGWPYQSEMDTDWEYDPDNPGEFVDKPKKPPWRAYVGDPMDLSQLGTLDLMVGRIIHVEPHHLDPNMYFFEYVEVGDRINKLFVRGLNKFFTPDFMELQRVVMLYVALPGWENCQESRPLSVLCARTPDKVEFLEPPETAQIGDRITVDGYINPVGPPDSIKPWLPFHADEWELLGRVAPDFRVNTEGVATYKGVPLRVQGHEGFVTAFSLTDCPVR